MRTIKQITLITLILFTISCSRKQQINGFYYGKYKTEDLNLPVLIHFKNRKYIDFFSFQYDTLTYRRIGDKFYFRSKLYHSSYKLTIIQKDKELLYYRNGNDTLIYKLKKGESSNYLFDYLSDKQIKIQLPNGNGKIQSYGFENKFHNPLYFTKYDNILVVNFNDSTIVFDENFYKYLLDYKSNLSYLDSRFSPITLIADKDLSINEINFLKVQLKIADYRNISYVLSINEYNKINYISRYIPPLTESDLSKYKTYNFVFPPLPPPPPPILDNDSIIDHGFLIEYFQGKILLNNDSLEASEFCKLLKEKILSDPKAILAYYISDRYSYQDYIKLLELTSSVFYDLRDEYLYLKYGIKFRGLSHYEDMYDEAIKKFPNRSVELDSIDYITIKYAL
ncbi:MAG: hypothetical protein HPY60_11665 [Candidatus Methanofastidiosum sp.]|nr:hypothetical protein [Methanofastidiosum sp.]